MKKLALKYSTVMALLVIVSSACIRLDPLLYNPNTDLESYGLDDFEGYQEIDLPASYDIPDSLISLFTLESDLNGDLADIYCVYLGDQSKIATDSVILYLHGNAGNLDFYWNRIKLLANVNGKNNYGVMAIDYRGFGLSEGSPTEEGLYVDADRAMQWLKEKGLTNDRLIIYGFSLGSAPATELTANPRTLTPSMLLLESPFASDEVMVQDASGLSLPGSYFSNLQINNAEEIQKVQQPFFWIHGTSDDFLAMETHGEVVFKNYKGIYAEAHRISGAGHGNVPSTMGYDTYKEAVGAFLNR